MNIKTKSLVTIMVSFAVLFLLLGFVGRKTSSEIKAQNEAEKENYNVFGSKNSLCNIISDDFVSTAIGQKVLRHEFSDGRSNAECDYFISEDGFISVIYDNNQDVNNQKNSLKLMDETIASDAAISMNHFIAVNKDESIQGVYLLLDEKSYISIIQNNESKITKDKFLILAENIEKIIKSSVNQSSTK
jgi:hypothetical protein